MKIGNGISKRTTAVVTVWQCLATLAAVLALGWFYAHSRDDFVPLVDHANLAFHEAGHIIFGVFGRTVGLYGGTAGQFVFPVIVIVIFLRKAQWFAAALGLIWLFQNMIYMARYMADARARRLPLVGGGDHDWATIFSRWHALSSDIAIANAVTTAAWLGMTAVVLWLGAKWIAK